MIAPTAGAAADDSWAAGLRKQVRKAKELTDKPFGVNISLRRGETEELFAVAIEEGIKIVTTIGGSPKQYTKYLKDYGIKVIQPVFSVRHAQGAEAAGVDLLVASGWEAGGRLSQDELTTFVLTRAVAGSVKIPVVAAGGIADGRGFLAALALGAEGIYMGTRFLATLESLAHPRYKEAILKADFTDTVVTGRKMDPARVLNTPAALKIREVEEKGASPQEVLDFIGVGRIRTAALEGNIEEGSAMLGQISGLIKDVPSARDVVQKIFDEAVLELKRLNALASAGSG